MKSRQELQKNVLKEVLNKKVKKCEAANRLQVSRVTLDKWLHRYVRFGESGIEKQVRKKHPAALFQNDWVCLKNLEVWSKI